MVEASVSGMNRTARNETAAGASAILGGWKVSN